MRLSVAYIYTYLVEFRISNHNKYRGAKGEKVGE